MSRVPLAGLLLCTVCSCVYAQVLTEQQVLNLFDQQSPMRREALAASAAAVEEVRSRTLWPNPTASYSRETVGFTEFIQAEQQIPLSGRLGYTKQAMEPAREFAEAQGVARIWQMRSTVREAFYRALAAQQQADLLRFTLTEINKIIELLRVREEEGEGSLYDRMRVEREAAGMRADVALAEARARSERAVLLAYLPEQAGLPTLAGDLRPQVVPQVRATILTRALDERAEIRAESSRLVQLSFEERAADRLRIPEPVITGGMKRTQVAANRNDTGVVFGVSIALPTFNKGRAEVARLSAEQERVAARRDLLRQQIVAAVSGAYEAYVGRFEALEVFERETGDTGVELVRIAQVGYEEGELGILELLDAYRVDRQTKLRRVELESAVRESEIELTRNAGYEVTQ